MRKCNYKSILLGIILGVCLVAVLGSGPADYSQKHLFGTGISFVTKGGQSYGGISYDEMTGDVSFSLHHPATYQNTFSVNLSRRSVALKIKGTRGVLWLNNEVRGKSGSYGPALTIANDQGTNVLVAAAYGNPGDGWILLRDIDPQNRGSSDNWNVMQILARTIEGSDSDNNTVTIWSAM